MIDEGYTKFKLSWTRAAALDLVEIETLIRWRRRLYAAGLVGYYEQIGVGYGNISLRTAVEKQFIISGTQTGHLAELGSEHFSLVTDHDLDSNRIACRGPIQASSESMTHASIYALDASIHAVVHAHSTELWLRSKDVLPTTVADVAYGTPEMAREFERLYRHTDFAIKGLAIMAGHEDGLIAIGRNMQEATERLLALHGDSGSVESR